MPRTWLPIPLLLTAAVAAQGPTDPTSCSLGGLMLGSNPDCTGIGPSWGWPIGPGDCYRASVLGVLDAASLAPAQGPFSYVTGHADPATGREFALLSAWNGLVVVDTHDIAAMGPTPFVPPYWVLPDPMLAIHRGAISFGEHVYESNAFRPSLRVLHIGVAAVPPSVTVTQLPDVPLPSIGSSYRLTVDRERGHLYVPGFDGLRIYDVNGANAAAPQLLAVWRGWIPGSTVASFDVHLHRDGPTVRAVVSEYLSAGATHIAVLDVTTLPAGVPAIDPWLPTEWVAWIAGFPGSGNAHSAWMPEDGAFLYSSIGDVATVVYDMRGFPHYAANRVLTLAEAPPRMQVNGSNPPTDLVYPAAPRRHIGLQGIGHAGYAPSWQDGVLLYDLRTDRANPNEVLAQVDTSPCSPGSTSGGPQCSQTYPGVFGVHRLQDSGVVYAADDTNGLFLLRLNVGHVHRFGVGTAEVHGGVPLVPRIVTEDAPPRMHFPWAPDPDQGITIRDLVPGRAVVLAIATDGLAAGVPFPAPGSPCLSWLGGIVAGALITTADAQGRVEVALPPVLPEQFRLFLQAFSFAPVGLGYDCVAASRGTWFGIAGP
jgi:hypothetical protein